MATLQRISICKAQCNSRMYRVGINASFAKICAPVSTTISSGSNRLATIVKVAAGSLSASDIPTGYQQYETLVVLRPDLSDDERDTELAKFEAFLKREECRDINVTVRGRQKLAYPIKRFAEGLYVLYDYIAPSKTSQAVQRVLSTPEAGSELNILRHMTFRV